MINYADDAQTIIADRIGAIPDLRKDQVHKIIKQNKKELRYLISCDLAKVRGLLIVIAVDDVDPLDKGVVNVVAQVMVSETVALHRTGPDVITAMDAAQMIGEELGEDGTGIKWRGTRQEAGEDSILVATTKLEMVLRKKEG